MTKIESYMTDSFPWDKFNRLMKETWPPECPECHKQRLLREGLPGFRTKPTAEMIDDDLFGGLGFKLLCEEVLNG